MGMVGAIPEAPSFVMGVPPILLAALRRPVNPHGYRRHCHGNDYGRGRGSATAVHCWLILSCQRHGG